MSSTSLVADLCSKLSSRVSCTVSINNKVACVHDNIWKRCKVSLGFSMADEYTGSLRNRKDTPS